MKHAPLLNDLGRSTFFTALLICSLGQGIVTASDWPAWRGPSAEGSVSKGHYPRAWKAEEAAWSVALPGKGGSTPIVSNGTIYLTTPSGEEDAVQAISLEGKVLWERKLGVASAPKHRSLGSSSNASPVTDGETLFAYFRSGRLVALERDGSVRWQRNLTEEHGAEELFWDAGSSPVVTDHALILTRLHAGDSWVAGFDKKNGKMLWQQKRQFQVPLENDNGYTTPVLYKETGKEAFLVWASDHLTAHDASNGKALWQCGGFNPEGTEYWPAIASPVLVGDVVVVPAGRDDRNQASMHGIRIGGSGDVTGSHRVWQRDGLGVFVPAPAVHQGRVYLLRNRGGLICLDPKTGQTLWEGEFPKHRSSYYASPVVAGDLLYAIREDGTVFVAKVSEGFEFISENPMGERIVASPVPVDGRLLLRGDEHLFCIQGP